MKALLSGRTIVQLSTSTSQEASDSEQLLSAAGALCPDGAISCGPDDIATPSALVLVSGDEAAFSNASGLLAALGEDVTGAAEGALAERLGVQRADLPIRAGCHHRQPAIRLVLWKVYRIFDSCG